MLEEERPKLTAVLRQNEMLPLGVDSPGETRREVLYDSHTVDEQQQIVGELGGCKVLEWDFTVVQN